MLPSRETTFLILVNVKRTMNLGSGSVCYAINCTNSRYKCPRKSFFFRFLKDEAKYCNDNVHKALICEPRDLPVKGGDGR